MNYNCIGAYGYESFATNRKVTLGISAFIAGLCVIFFIVASSGWSNSESVLKSASWGYVSGSGINAWYGLQAFYIHDSIVVPTQGNGSESTDDGIIEFASSNCSDASCAPCQSAGVTAFGLTIVSLLNTIAVLVFTILRSRNDSTIYKLTNLMLCFTIAILSLSAFSSWQLVCYVNIQTDNGASRTYGAGFNCLVSGFFFILVVFAINFLTPSGKRDFCSGALSRARDSASHEREYNDQDLVMMN